MKMKSLLFSAAVFTLGCLTVSAQEAPPAGGPGNGPGGKAPMKLTVEGLKGELKLTDDQVKKLQPLVDKVNADREAFRKEMMAEREKNAGTPPDREKMKGKMEEQRKKVMDTLAPAKEFLSADQFKQLTEKINKRPGGNKRGGNNATPPAPAAN